MSGYKVTVRGARPRFPNVSLRCLCCGEEWDILTDDAQAERCPVCDEIAGVVPRIATPLLGTVWGSAAVRGKSDERPGPGTMNTSLIADGKLTPAEFKAQRKKMWQDRDRAEWKAKTG